MSIAAMAWAKRQTVGNSGRKLVLLVLADYATYREDWRPDGTDRHFAWASQRTIARDAEMTDRSVRTHLEALEAAGLIRRMTRGGDGGGRQSDLVIFPVDDDGPQPFPVDNPVDTSVDDDVDNGNRKNLPEGATGNSEQGNRKNGAGAPYIEPPPEPPSSIRPEVDELCELLKKRVEENGSRTPTITRAWHDSARLLIDRDGYTPEQIRYLIEWSQRHHFWRSNILSMPTLRKQADRLKLQAQEEYRRQHPEGRSEEKPRFQTAQERSQQHRDDFTERAKVAEAWVQENGGDPEDVKLVLSVMKRIESGELQVSATRTPDMYSDGDVIDAEVISRREVTAGEGQ